MEEKKRLIYPDVLRIVSIFAVIVIHAVGELWKIFPMHSKSWISLVTIDSMVRFAVPVFVMVSGIFMLSPAKDRSLKDLYSKKILRIATSFAFWSVIYLVYRMFFDINHKIFPVKSIIGKLILGEYHMWFMYMIIGLYMVTPFIRKITDSKSSMQYFLILWFAFCIIKNFAKLIPGMNDFVFKFFDSFKFSIAVEYSGYYVLGYYLHNFPLKKPTRIFVYILSLFGVAATAFLTVYVSFKSSECVSKYFEYLLPTTLFSSISVFSFIQNICKDKNPTAGTRKRIATLSKISFGVYLSHLLVMMPVKQICLTHFSLPGYAIFGILVVSTTVISPIISYVLNKIPIINKYLV